jgi:hypothetical protein
MKNSPKLRKITRKILEILLELNEFELMKRLMKRLGK